MQSPWIMKAYILFRDEGRQFGNDHHLLKEIVQKTHKVESLRQIRFPEFGGKKSTKPHSILYKYNRQTLSRLIFYPTGKSFGGTIFQPVICALFAIKLTVASARKTIKFC